MENITPDFNMVLLHIGIDVHKKQWTVTILVKGVHHRTFSQPPRPDALKTYLDKWFPNARVYCAYEASKFGFWICRELLSYGYECIVINPADIPTSSEERTNKTDSRDSRKIARLLKSGLLRAIHLPDQQTETDRQLFRFRKKLWGDLVRVKNRIKDKFIFAGISIPAEFDTSYWTKAFLQWLKEVDLPNARLRITLNLLLEQYHFLYRHFLKTSIEVRKLQSVERYKVDAKLLRTIPGIGPLTTVQILTELQDIKRFENFKKLNSFIGFKPMVHASGDHDWRGRMTYRRHKALRSALVECAWTSIIKDPAMQQRYADLKKRLTPKRAIIIIARKLLSRIYYVLKNQKPYELGIR
ncbi:MAG TPA: IS110 family transposase [Cyclobacteriaceae bacterium]|nr:IS110 family transposase [Cyclobacteriaceae bacterium]